MRFRDRFGLVSAAAAVSLLLVGVPSVFGQTAPGFEDVPEGHVAEEAISWAADNGVTEGVGDNRFGVGQTLTRYEMVTFLCRAYDPGSCQSGVSGSDSFGDVPSGHWADYSVGWAADRGITSGVSATEFGGSQTLTREQMITFLYRAEGSPTGGSDGIEVFRDGPDRGHWASLPMGWAYDQGVTGGIAAGTFGFGTNVSREEMVLFLCRTVAPGTCQPSQDPLPSSVVPETTTTRTPTAQRVAYAAHNGVWVENVDGTNKQHVHDSGGNLRWSSDGTRIAYTASDGLWVADADGTDKQRLTEDGSYHKWSPDGTRIAYKTSDDELWVTGADGTNQQQLGRIDSIFFLDSYHFVWSPNGSRIAYRTNDRSLWVADADGTNKQQLRYRNNGYRLLWSPDSTKIAYFSSDGEFWVADADGTNKQQLPFSSFVRQWSPDGTKIAFTSQTDRPSVKVLWVADPDLTNRRQLAEIHAYGRFHVRWSPDSTKIAYEPSSGALWVMNADGTNRQHIHDDFDSFTGPLWSPDSTRVAYYASGHDSDRPWMEALWVANADGTNKQLVGEGSTPRWSPDSTKIAYKASDGLWVVAADGTNKQPLTDPAQHYVSSSDLLWSPDSTRIAYWTGSSGLWVIDADGTNQRIIAEDSHAYQQIWSPR